MCQYSAEDGIPDDWHLVHLGSRAVGGAGLVLTEACAVCPDGRITPWDTGIWSGEQAEAWKPIADFIKSQGAVPGIQLAHAGRKAACDKPWNGGRPLARDAGGWRTHGPSDTPFGDYPAPRAMSVADLEACVSDFHLAAERALQAGFEVAEVHAAHGYLLHDPLAALQPARGRIRRLALQPHALPARGGEAGTGRGMKLRHLPGQRQENASRGQIDEAVGHRVSAELHDPAHRREHHQAGAVTPLEGFPAGIRVGSMALSIWGYLGNLLWPQGLAVFYPHLMNRLPVGTAALAGVPSRPSSNYAANLLSGARSENVPG